MSIKGKIYKKYLFQAKYVVKGKKLKNSTAVVKRKYRMCPSANVECKTTDVVHNVDFEMEESIQMPKNRFNMYDKIVAKRSYSETSDANLKIEDDSNQEYEGTTVIEREKLNDSNSDMQLEMERIRLLELAREKKEKLDQERIEKAREKQEEKLLKEKKLEEQARREKEKQLQNVEKEKKIKEYKTKQRKNESKSFIIVAALLAIIIVAGIANIGKTMYKEIKKDNVLVGDAGREDEDDKKTLFDGLSIFTPEDTSTEAPSDEQEQKIEEDEENIDDIEEIIVADSSTMPPTTSSPTATQSNKTDIKEYLNSISNTKDKNTNTNTDTSTNTPTSEPKEEEEIIPSVGDSSEIETGSDEETKKQYVEVLYSGSNFELYKTSKDNITKSTVKAGQCIKYTKYKEENGVIMIPISDADGMWFIMEGDIVKEKFAFDGENVAGIAVIVLMDNVEGKDIEDDIIYAKQGTDVKINGIYFTKDDEGAKLKEYKSVVKNVVGKMVLYKKTGNNKR